MSFSLRVSHRKFLMRQYWHKIMSYHPYSHRVFWWMILWHMIHCTLFFIWVFPFEVSHIKFLTRQCLYKVICHIIKFSPSGFLEDDIRAYWPYGQGVIRLRLWAYLKRSNNIGDCISRGFSLFSIEFLRSFTWYTNSTLDFSHWVFPKSLLTFS
jgi:hypothetical protein